MQPPADPPLVHLEGSRSRRPWWPRSGSRAHGAPSASPPGSFAAALRPLDHSILATRTSRVSRVGAGASHACCSPCLDSPDSMHVESRWVFVERGAFWAEARLAGLGSGGVSLLVRADDRGRTGAFRLSRLWFSFGSGSPTVDDESCSLSVPFTLNRFRRVAMIHISPVPMLLYFSSTLPAGSLLGR